MKIHIGTSIKKKYVEIMPTVAINWRKPITIYFGWIVWSITFEI